MAENPFRLHPGLSALGGAELLDALASKLETYPPGQLPEPEYVAAAMRLVAEHVRKGVVGLLAELDAKG